MSLVKYRVLNLRHIKGGFSNGRVFRHSVYIGRGRGSKFGNPYLVSKGGRDSAIAKFELLVDSDPKFRALIRKELRGKNLVCWCAPLPCHGDILLEIANKKALA